MQMHAFMWIRVMRGNGILSQFFHAIPIIGIIFKLRTGYTDASPQLPSKESDLAQG